MLHKPVRYKCQIFCYGYDCVSLCGEVVIFSGKAYRPVSRADHCLDGKNLVYVDDRKVYLQVGSSLNLSQKLYQVNICASNVTCV